MILKGSQRSGGPQLARHLMNAKDNDHVSLHELRGFVSDDLIGAFKESHAISLGTRCSQFLFSLSLNPPELENVPISVFEEAIEAIEKKLGLIDQPRAVVFHEKSGRRHAHCVWSRIDAERMRALNLPHFKIKLRDISRQLYLENNWQMPPGLQNSDERDPRNYTQSEGQQAKRVKMEPQALKALFQKCWASSDSKTAFAHALKEKGFILAKGDRRGFVAVDHHGEVYAISRWVRIKTKDVRARLGETHGLPSVEEAIGLITAQISEEVNTSYEKTEAEFYKQTQELERKRVALVTMQRQEREALRQSQQDRITRQSQTGDAQLPTGLKAAWMKLSGQYQKTIKNNEVQVQHAKKRDQAEWQKLIERQLKERRTLQHHLRQLHFHHEIETQSLHQELGKDLLQLDFGLGTHKRFPVIDPKQPLVINDDDDTLSIAKKVRQSPDYILDVISDKKEFFTRNDIVRGLAKYIEDPATLRLAIDHVLQSKELIEVHDESTQRYTTREFQNLKTTLASQVSSMDQNKDFGVRSSTIKKSISYQNSILQKSVGANLSAEQEAAIHHILGTNQLSVVVGFAGAGKSTLLAAAKSAWEQHGHRVIGAALSGKAADGLENSSGISARTLASLEYSWKHGYQKLQVGDVLVIDEAGMVGTKQLARVINHVQLSGAKVVLVGDPEQLQPIQAGSPFKDITNQISTAQVTEIRRQKEDWQRVASRQFAQQKTLDAIRSYESQGYVTTAEDRSTTIVNLVDDYMKDMKEHGVSSSRLALAHRRKDVHIINQSIRAARKSKGDLIEEKLIKTDHGPRALANGDRVLFTRNDRELGLRNGMLGTVEKAEKHQLTVLIDGDSEEQAHRITITPKHYRSLDHGYATTIHKSQGATVDRAFVLASKTMDRHMTYVAMTRHKLNARLYSDKNTLRKMTRTNSIESENRVSRTRKFDGPRR